MKNLITSDIHYYSLTIYKSNNRVTRMHFTVGWRLIQFLSNINEKAQNN